jgi:signal transduction histidine kinase
MSAPAIQVLLVTADPQTERQLRLDLSAYTRTRMDLTHRKDLETTLATLATRTFDAAFLDLALPGSHGFDSLHQLHLAARAMPVIVLANSDNETLAIEAVRKGAQDYLVKSRSDARVLSRIVRYAIERKRIEEALRLALARLSASHEQLKATRLQLIQAEKLECIGTLAAGVAHEVKNPLQTLLMGVHYLSSRAGGDEELQLVIREMRDSIHRADLIVRELVTFAGTNHPEKREGSLNAIIEQALHLMRYELIHAHVQVVLDLDPALPSLPLDVNKLEQAFLNLFLNAVQAMPHGGTLSVRTWGQPAGHGVTDARPDGPGPSEVVAEVGDTGEGIPAGKLQQIFNPFYTLKPAGKGTGLGLTVTRRIIELHGGVIEAQNGDSGGARFVARFPLQPQDPYERETNPDC